MGIQTTGIWFNKIYTWKFFDRINSNLVSIMISLPFLIYTLIIAIFNIFHINTIIAFIILTTWFPIGSYLINNVEGKFVNSYVKTMVDRLNLDNDELQFLKSYFIENLDKYSKQFAYITIIISIILISVNISIMPIAAIPLALFVLLIGSPMVGIGYTGTFLALKLQNMVYHKHFKNYFSNKPGTIFAEFLVFSQGSLFNVLIMASGILFVPWLFVIQKHFPNSLSIVLVWLYILSMLFLIILNIIYTFYIVYSSNIKYKKLQDAIGQVNIHSKYISSEDNQEFINQLPLLLKETGTTIEDVIDALINLAAKGFQLSSSEIRHALKEILSDPESFHVL